MVPARRTKSSGRVARRNGPVACSTSPSIASLARITPSRWRESRNMPVKGGWRGALLVWLGRFGGQTDFGDVGRDQDIEHVDHSLVIDDAVGAEDNVQVRIGLSKFDQGAQQ